MGAVCRRALGTGPAGVPRRPDPPAQPPKSVQVCLRKTNKTQKPAPISQALAVRPPRAPLAPPTQAPTPHSHALCSGPVALPLILPPGQFPRFSSPASLQQPGWNLERGGAAHPLLSTSGWRPVSPCDPSDPQDARPRPSGSPRLSGSPHCHPGLLTVPSGWSSSPGPAASLAGHR